MTKSSNLIRKDNKAEYKVRGAEKLASFHP
jgi:hypothetical protein